MLPNSTTGGSSTGLPFVVLRLIAVKIPQMKVSSEHVTEEQRVKYSVALIREAMKRQREELALTKAEIPRLQKRCKDLEKDIKKLEKLVKSAPS